VLHDLTEEMPDPIANEPRTQIPEGAHQRYTTNHRSEARLTDTPDSSCARSRPMWRGCRRLDTLETVRVHWRLLAGLPLMREGFWSDGRRLKDSVKMGAEGLSECRLQSWC
jgi:hypothetical protein